MFREATVSRDNAHMRLIYRKLIKILVIFVVGSAFTLTSIEWLGLGIENENTQIAAVCLGLLGLAICSISLFVAITVGLSSKKKGQKLMSKEKKDGREKTGN